MGDPRSGRGGSHLAFFREEDRERLRALSPRKHAVQQRSRETVDTILEGAAQVFERIGFEKATTDRIAQVAGVSIGSLYQYFPNKEAIACAWMERHGQEGAARLLPVLEHFANRPPPLGEGVRELVRAIVDPHLERLALHRALADGAPIPAVVRVRRRKLALAMAPALESWLRSARGEDATPSPARAAAVIAASIAALVHGLIADPLPACPLEAGGPEIERLRLGYLSERGREAPRG
jgi:AcrR family transcriptional regulator